MSEKSDPLAVLLAVKREMKTELSDELLRSCYELHSEQQYDKNRTTQRQLQDLVEEEIEGIEGTGSSAVS